MSVTQQMMLDGESGEPCPLDWQDVVIIVGLSGEDSAEVKGGEQHDSTVESDF